MQKFTISNIIDFARASERVRLTIVKNHLEPKNPNLMGSGGDYWISCISALGRACIENDASILTAKSEEITDKIKNSDVGHVQKQYVRNKEIVDRFCDFDFSRWHSKPGIQFLEKPKAYEDISIDGIPVRVNPTVVYEYYDDELRYIGGIWIVPKIGSLNARELALCADALDTYFRLNYEADAILDVESTLIIDAMTKEYVSLAQLRSGELVSPLGAIISDIKKAS